MNLYDLLISPFAEFDFMRYALASVFCLALSAAPVGVFLVMRRMSLVGDALSHAVLPGAAIGYMFAGLSLDRKSTRLNSSHLEISYAVFCLKKKNRWQICR